MHRRKKGTLKSGSGRTVKSRKQAIAIGLSEAREKGAKVPLRKSSGRSSRKNVILQSGLRGDKADGLGLGISNLQVGLVEEMIRLG